MYLAALEDVYCNEPSCTDGETEAQCGCITLLAKIINFLLNPCFYHCAITFLFDYL